MKERFVLQSEADLTTWAKDWKARFRPGDRIALNGELGVGKTSLVRHLLRAWNYDETVTSPSFPILIEYELADFHLVHIDAFRLKPGDKDVFDPSDWTSKIVFVEWPERSPIPPESFQYRITMSFASHEGERILEIEKL